MPGIYMFRSRRPVAIAFDMDETLGHFTQLGAFWDCVEYAHSRSLAPSVFCETANLYTEFVRPGIPEILSFVSEARDNGLIDLVCIYTNNNGPRRWAQYIAAWLESLAGRRVFDIIIPAYMVGGKIVEPKRTSHAKSHSDFCRCTGMPPATRLCFIDDQEHPLMRSPNVFYIKPQPFHAGLLPSELGNRYVVAHPTLPPTCKSRLGRAVLSNPYVEPGRAVNRSRADLHHESEWLAYHIQLFIAHTAHRVTRRARPRAGGTRRRFAQSRN